MRHITTLRLLIQELYNSHDFRRPTEGHKGQYRFCSIPTARTVTQTAIRFSRSPGCPITAVRRSGEVGDRSVRAASDQRRGSHPHSAAGGGGGGELGAISHTRPARWQSDRPALEEFQKLIILTLLVVM